MAIWKLDVKSVIVTTRVLHQTGVTQLQANADAKRVSQDCDVMCVRKATFASLTSVSTQQTKCVCIHNNTRCAIVTACVRGTTGGYIFTHVPSPVPDPARGRGGTPLQGWIRVTPLSCLPPLGKGYPRAWTGIPPPVARTGVSSSPPTSWPGQDRDTPLHPKWND